MPAKVILVTGANGGMGQAIARAFLTEGEDSVIWLGVREHRQKADSLAREYPERARPVELNAADPEAWKRAVDLVLKQSERLDVLVNNAGKHADGLLGALPEDAWHSVIDTNLNSVFFGCQAVLPGMISQRYGRIVNISSLSALLAPPGQANYAAAKAGVVALTRSLAKEIARLGITVNAVCPGYIETDALATMTQEQKTTALSRVPMRRFGRPDEVAAAVKFFSSPEAGYITGSVMKIDGGIY